MQDFEMANKTSIKALLLLLATTFALAQPSPRTKVVFLGTGVPGPNPERSGPATAIVVDDRAYLIDIGAGVMRRAAAAAEKGVTGVEPGKLTIAFITHLHSDHTIGLPDLIFTGWAGRKQLDIYGPAGTKAMTDDVLAAWKRDIEIRTRGLEQRKPLVVIARDAKPGVIYRDDKVTVTAFAVPHGNWKSAFGYRFQTPDRVIVISGDTTPSDELVAQCNRCDLLIHEVYSPSSVVPQMPDWKAYRAKYHTSTDELAALATRAKPKLLAVYHIAGRNPNSKNGRYTGQEILNEIKKSYSGPVVVAEDLDVY